MLDTTQKPLLLIPETEVEELFREIKMTFDIQISFVDATIEPGLQLGFQQEGSPRPRFLGRLTNLCSVIDLEAMIPGEGSAAEEQEVLDERSLPIFRAKMSAAIQAGKQKSQHAKDKRRIDRMNVKKGWCAELKRAQCYLGLRPRGTARKEDFYGDPNMSWDDSQRAQEEYEKAAGIRLPPIDLAASAPFPFDRNVVFVCVDVEAYERDQRRVTEIGISTLDTLDMIKVPPGERGEEWMKLMRCRHFRIVETSHLNNSEFISGCADRFREQFGTSEWISIKQAPQVIASCFKSPFSTPGQYTPYPASIHDVPRHGFNVLPLVQDDPNIKRNIILLGHDVRSDIDYLRKIGYDVGNVPNVVEAIDTVNMYRAFKHEQNPRSLGSVLLEFDIAGWYLHNAVSDFLSFQMVSSSASGLQAPILIQSRVMTQHIQLKP